ncbi:MAG TPA: NfeD family protein [Terriglobales bacterium]|nr:NfeD family protein [Terriglobales bacterium]
MTLTDFYLLCFIVGFVLSLLSFLGGGARPHFHFSGKLHLPHIGRAGGHVTGGTPHSESSMPLFNFSTLVVFLTWFGGVGYLLTKYSTLWTLAVLALAALSGVGGAAFVFLLVAKLLLAHEQELDPADYDMVGVIGTITNPIRAGGTGEIVYSQQGTRRSTGARSEDGAALPRGTEVVVTRYEKGIAYVRRWEELAGTEMGSQSEPVQK